MVVLVTGAGGFVGRHVLSSLADSGSEIHATFTNSKLSAEEIAIWHRADLLDTGSMRNVLAQVRPSHLMHLAWHVAPGQYWSSYENVRWLNASLDLITEFARLGGKRAILTGTCAEYSWTAGGLLRENETLLAPSTLYGACKQALGSVSLQLAKELGISVGHARIFFPYGPYEHHERLVPSVILSLLHGQPALCTLGRQIRDYMYVADVAGALVAMLLSELTGPVNIGTGQGLAVADMVALIGIVTGRTDLIRLGALPAREGDPKVLIADAEKLKTIGFVPEYTPEAGIEDTVRFWKDRLVRS